MATKCDDSITRTVTHSSTGLPYKAVMLAMKIDQEFWCQLTLFSNLKLYRREYVKITEMNEFK